MERLYKIKKTEVEMMILRDYMISNVNVIKLDTQINYIPVDMTWITEPENTYEYFKNFIKKYKIFRDRYEFTSVYTHNNIPNKNVIVVYTKDVDDNFFTKFTKTYKHIIVISNNLLPTKLMNKYQPTKIESFTDNELAFNRLKHAYSPISIEYIRNDMVEKWAQNEELPVKSLPLILDEDIIPKMYGAKTSGVFKMEQIGLNTETYIMYRLVRKTPDRIRELLKTDK